MPGPLDGYRVVDLTNISGPLATMILADQGADVIKVEPPEAATTPALGNRRGGFSASFLNNNRNKRSIALDLKTPEARAAVLKLAATADVFIQNFRPGVVERMGLGEDAVRAVAPTSSTSRSAASASGVPTPPSPRTTRWCRRCPAWRPSRPDRTPNGRAWCAPSCRTS